MHPGLYAVEFAAFGSWGRCSFDPGFPLRPFSSWILEDEDEERFGSRPGEKNAIGTDHKRDPQGPALVALALWHGRTGFAPMDLSLRFSFCSKPRHDSLKRVAPKTAKSALILWIPALADAAHLFPCAVRPFLAVIEKKDGGGARSRFRSSLSLLPRCSEDKEWALCHHTAKNGRACRDRVAPGRQRPLAAHNGPHGIWCQRDNMIT